MLYICGFLWKVPYCYIMLIINKLTNKVMRLGAAVLLLGALLGACKSDWTVVGDALISGESRWVYLDDQPVRLSTFRYDSVVTSGVDQALVGCCTDPHIGLVQAEAYIGMGNNSQRIVGQNVNLVLDSVRLELYHSNFFFGDSMAITQLNVHRLTEEVAPRLHTSNIYNTQQFAYDPVPMASTSYRLRPSYRGMISMELPKSLGEELMGYLQLPVRPSEEADGLNRYFKGIRIGIEGSSSKAIMGYLVNDTSCCIKLYYHSTNDVHHIEYVHKINATSSYNRSNRIELDAANPVLARLSNEPVVSDSIGNVGLVQSALGIYTRIDFPALREHFRYGGKLQVARAELQLCPAPSMDLSSRPQSIYLYQVDRNNNIGSQLLNSSTGTAEGGRFTLHPDFFGQTYYSWDITQFVRSMVQAPDVENYGLMLVPDVAGTSFNQLVVADQQHDGAQTKLILYLLNHE